MKKILIIILAFVFSAGMPVLAQKTIKKESETEKKFPVKKGNLRLVKDNVKLNYVKNTEIRNDTLRVYNDWNKNMTLGFENLPAHMEAIAIPTILEPKKEGMVVVKYNAAKKGDFGYSFENLNIITDDTLEASKSLFVMVYIEEDFSMLSKEQMENAPRISFETEKLEFGKIKSGERVKYNFTFTNKGKSDLIIRKTKASCGCTASEPAKSVLKPGESSTININFDTTGMKGDEHKTVYVYNNDPRYSTVALHITGIVE